MRRVAEFYKQINDKNAVKIPCDDLNEEEVFNEIIKNLEAVIWQSR